MRAGKTYHEPTGWCALRRTLRDLEVEGDDVFIDLGSGVGRVVVLAGIKLPVERVIGVEIDERLHGIAKRNVARLQGRFRARTVELVHADLTEYEIPDDVTIVYAFAPVYGELMDVVIGKLLASVDRRPRVVRLVYANPFEHNRLIARGRFRAIDAAATRWPYWDRVGTDICVTYVVMPEVPVDGLDQVLQRGRERMRGAEQWFSFHDPGLRIQPPGEAAITPERFG
jgi:hypothetical protein